MDYFTSLVKSSDIQPQSQWLRAKKRSGYIFSILRDELTLSSWLAIGACMNALLYLAMGRIALMLPFLLLLFRLGDALLITYGIKSNPKMEGVIMKKFSAQLPNPDGTIGPKPANQQVVVFLIGARCNHPLGALAPGFKELGDFFTKMTRDVERNAEKYDFLGSSDWIANGERPTGNEVLNVMYFKTSEGLHKFAHDPIHREGWDWWNKTIKQHPYLGIWHELYVSPAGHWESIYVNSAPVLLGATTYPTKTEGGKAWVSPIVDASRGPLKSSRGRMTFTDGKDNDQYGEDPYKSY